MSALLAKVVRKLARIFTCLRFRLSHRLFTGRVEIDRLSLERVSWARNVTLRGSVSVRDASLSVGAGCSIAQSSQLGVEAGGTLVLDDGVSVGPRSIISTTSGQIAIGRNTSFFSDCIISGEVDIGPDCLLANNVTVLTGTHEIHGAGTIRENDAAARLRPDYRPYQPVSIGADCWLGANSVVLPGVTLGRGCVVGANAVVTKSFPNYSILAGVPAVVIGSRSRDGETATPV